MNRTLALCVILVICVVILLKFCLGKRKQKKNDKIKKEEKTDEVQPAGSEETMKAEGITEVNQEAEPSGAESFQVGKVHETGARQEQQDAFFVSDDTDGEAGEKGMLAVVADGMGGLSNGAAVSSLVVRTCMEIFYQQPLYASEEDILLQMAAAANDRVNQMLKGQIRSGSTLISCIVKDGCLHFLTIGDSRIYLYRSGTLQVLNREHVYQEELALHAVNRDESMERVRNDPQLRALTSYIGMGRLAHIDRTREGIRLKEGDKIILASDGVFGTLSAGQMEEALTHDVSEAAEQIRQMIETRGAVRQDNYTAVILEYKGACGEPDIPAVSQD